MPCDAYAAAAASNTGTRGGWVFGIGWSDRNPSSTGVERQLTDLQIVIVGCNQVGTRLAGELVDNGDIVYIIDCETANLDRLPRSLVDSDLLTLIFGDASSSDTLNDADVENADAFITLTGDDVLNGLVAQKAHFVYRVPRALCLIKDNDLRKMYNDLGLETLDPSQMIAKAVSSALLVS